MGVHLSLEYPHFRDLQPRYLTNRHVEELAWKVRLQLRCAESCHLKVPLDLLFGIDGATVNGLRMTFRWEVEGAIEDEQGDPVLGVCDCDPREWPDLIMLSANSSMIRGFEALLRSVLVHELGHGLCDGPGWLTAYRKLMLSGSSPNTMSSDRMRALTPDERHLFASRDAASKFAEFRANVFMGAFLVPQPLVLEPLRHYARKLDIPLIEAPPPSGRGAARHAGSCRILPDHDDHGHFRLRPLFRALAPEFGVSPRFIHVRLLRYGLLGDAELQSDRRRSARP